MIYNLINQGECFKIFGHRFIRLVIILMAHSRLGYGMTFLMGRNQNPYCKVNWIRIKLLGS